MTQYGGFIFVETDKCDSCIYMRIDSKCGYEPKDKIPRCKDGSCNLRVLNNNGKGLPRKRRKK